MVCNIIICYLIRVCDYNSHFILFNTVTLNLKVLCMFCLNFIAAHHYNTRECKVSEKYRKVLGIGIGLLGDTDTLKLTRYPILRVLGIGFVPSLGHIHIQP